MSFRHGLQTYLTNPNQDLVLFHDDDYIIMKDGFPKSLRHYLVMPRSKHLTHKHPLEALKDPAVYAEAAKYVSRAKSMIIEDLVKQGYVDKDPAAQEKFKNTFIRAGIHAVPSMANLHIHVITQDFHSARMKHKKHYNSFTTPFFVDFDALEPTARDNVHSDDAYSDSASDSGSHSNGSVEELLMGGRARKRRAKVARFDPSRLEKSVSTTPLRCVYCGRNFGSQFKALKQHLEEEFAKKFPYQ